MSWRNKLLKAKINGLEIFVESSELQTGRRIVTHEFPQRDKPFVEDLGRKTRKFNIEAWYAESPRNNFNHWTRRDAVIDEIEKDGEVKFQHPYFGELRGYVEDFNVSESAQNEGGYVKFSFTFIEKGEINFRAIKYKDTYGFMSDAYNDFFESVLGDFDDAWNLEELFGVSYDEAYSIFQDTSQTISKVGRIAKGDLSAFQQATALIGLSNVSGTIAQGRYMAGLLSVLYKQVSGLPNPKVYKSKIKNDTNTASFNKMNAAMYAAEFGKRAADKVSTQNRPQVESVGLRGSPFLMSRQEVESLRRDAMTVMSDEIYALSGQDGFENTKQSLLTLRTAVIEHMTAEAENFGITFNDSFGSTMPSIVVAYKNYGVLRDDELNARNNIPNPLFVDKNSAIELVSDVSR